MYALALDAYAPDFTWFSSAWTALSSGPIGTLVGIAVGAVAISALVRIFVK